MKLYNIYQYIKTSGHTTVIKMRRKTINSFQLFLLVIVKNKEVICSLIGAIFSLATVSLRGGKKSRHKGNTAINVEKVL